MKKIHIVSPAKMIDKDCIDFAVDFFTKNGFDIDVATHALGQNNYFSGTDKERLHDFQQALDAEDVDFILCARGGYGSVRIIDSLDFSGLKKNPKLIIGFSDITVFHNHVHSNFSLPTLHASVPLNFKENTEAALSSLLNVLIKKPNKYQITSHSLNQLGLVEATIVGGNLSIIYSLIGTNSDIDISGKILFVEDIGEPIYAIDRMFYALEKSGKLKTLAALIVGGMTNIKDTEIPYNQSTEEIISSHTKKYNYPVCFNFPAGHISDNRAILLGSKAQLNITENGVDFSQDNFY